MYRAPDLLVIASRPEDFGRAVEHMRTGPLGADTETSGLDWLTERVGGLGLAAGTTAVYAYGDALGVAARYLSDQVKARRALVFHHAKFDMHHLMTTFGLHIPYPVDDSYLLSFLYDNRGVPDNESGYEPGHGLKPLTGYYLGNRAASEPEDDLMDSVKLAGGKDKGDLLLGDPELVGRYGALDPWYCLQLAAFLRKKLAARSTPAHAIQSAMQLYETERWLTLAIRDMERRGIAVDRAFFERWNRQLTKKHDAATTTLQRLAGDALTNWKSTPQLRRFLYETLGLKSERMTKRGLPSTDEVALLDLHHPAADAVLTLRDLEKQRGTYAEGLLAAIRADGRIHCTFRQTGARTGRLSSADPNLQQVPRESGARKGFRPDLGLGLYFNDFSQIEMRFCAHETNDPTLVAGFKTDPQFDTHAATGRRMYGVAEPTKQQRKFAKITNFLMIYGGGVKKLRESLRGMLDEGEAKQALREMGDRAAHGDLHYALAHKIMDRYVKGFPAIKHTRDAFSEQLRALGYVTNVFGRRRYLPEEECYKAFNSRVQGAAADQAKRSLVALYRELQLSGDIALVLQIHDEAVYLAERDPRVHRRALAISRDVTHFRVPIISELDWSQTTWQDKAKWTG